MRSRFARTFALGAALVAVLLLATGCDNPADPAAATVNGVDVSRDSFLDEAHAYAALPGDPYSLVSDTPHSYSSAGLAQLLSERIIDRVVLDAAKRYGIEPDASLISQYDSQLSTPSSSGQISPLNDLPADLRQSFLQARALENQLFEYVASNRWWTDDEAAKYDELVAAGEIPAVSCLHHILVDTEDEANQILSQLKAGASFEDLAAQHSTDTGSSASGGDLGCNPAGSFVDEFEAAIANAKTGDIVGPVATDFGFHIIRVDQAAAAPKIEDSGSSGWVAMLRVTTKVDLDRRYGTWDPATFTVTPPEGAQAPASGASDLPTP
jgi:parvulin-like peptidyl-prolyl cis-trans isomerase-like protein